MTAQERGMNGIVWTDDARDPCAYCVVWDESGPWVSPGVRAERMYQFTHDACERVVAQYVAEATL